MAIQTRRGNYADFDPDKMLPGELATVTSGDPGAEDGRSVYACFAAGDVKRMATYEDMQENIDQATQDIQEEFSAQLTQKINQADTAISQTQSATSAANTAAQGADEAKQEALEAAAAAESYVLGDISSKTVTFSEASSRANINTGESTSTLFGKIKKWLADLGAAAFQAVANNCTTNVAGSVLDARQGKKLQDQINQLNTKINNLRSWYDEYYVKQGYGAHVKYKDGSTQMPDGVYLVDAVITGTSMDTYTRYLVRIKQPAGIYKITGLQTVSSPDELQVNLYWGGESKDQLSIMTNNNTQYYTVTLGITQIA